MESLEAYRGFLRADRWAEWREHETDQRKGIPYPGSQKPYPPDADLIDLVPPEDLKIGRMLLIDAIRQRRSRRQFTEEPLSLEEISFLLWATQGIDWVATRAFRERLAPVMKLTPDEVPALLQTVPSTGSGHPPETYLFLSRVGDLQPGLYRYLSHQHKLLILKDAAQAEREARDVMRWIESRNMAALFVWTVIPYRTEWQYSFVAHKMIAHEAGHICQNLYLACEAIGAGTCAIGTYDQAEMDSLLGVYGDEESVIYLAPVGKVALSASMQHTS